MRASVLLMKQAKERRLTMQMQVWISACLILYEYD
jgi:hypothetical protein